MTHATRIRRVAAAAAKMAEHRVAAEAAGCFETADSHWEDYEAEVCVIFGLLATLEGQAALAELEKLAMAADFEAQPPFVQNWPDHPGDYA